MNTMHLFACKLILLTIGIGCSVGDALADVSETRVKLVRGEVITGANRLLGQPIYSYDFSASATFGFNTADELDPVGPLPIPLTPDTDPDAILATTFANLGAVPPDVVPNVNIPLRDVGTFVNGLLARAPVADHLDAAAPVVGPTQADPGDPDPVTLRDWQRGRGLAITRCGPDGNHASLFVTRLLPNRMYSAIGLWLAADGSFRPVSFGGVPNVIITDRHGGGNLTRQLNFCPADAATVGEGGFRLIGVAIIYHSAHIAWGAIPTPSAEGFLLPPGSVVHGHLWFDFGAGRRIIDD